MDGMVIEKFDASVKKGISTLDEKNITTLALFARSLNWFVRRLLFLPRVAPALLRYLFAVHLQRKVTVDLWTGPCPFSASTLDTILAEGCDPDDEEEEENGTNSTFNTFYSTLSLRSPLDKPLAPPETHAHLTAALKRVNGVIAEDKMAEKGGGSGRLLQKIEKRYTQYLGVMGKGDVASPNVRSSLALGSTLPSLMEVGDGDFKYGFFNKNTYTLSAFTSSSSSSSLSSISSSSSSSSHNSPLSCASSPTFTPSTPIVGMNVSFYTSPLTTLSIQNLAASINRATSLNSLMNEKMLGGIAALRRFPPIPPSLRQGRSRIPRSKRASFRVHKLISNMHNDLEILLLTQSFILKVLKMEIRYMCMTHLCKAYPPPVSGKGTEKHEEYFLPEDTDVEPHPCIVRLTKVLLLYAEEALCVLLPHHVHEIFGGIDQFITNISTRRTNKIGRYNLKGIEMMKANVCSIQQCLGAIYPQVDHAFEELNTHYLKLALEMQG